MVALTLISYGLFHFFKVWKFSDHDRPFDLALIILLFSFLLYAFGFWYLKIETLPKKWLWGFFVIINLLLFSVPPITSNDLNSYIYQGRVFSQYNQNPYQQVYQALPTDALYSQLNNKWSIYISPYGPAFSIIAGGLTYLGQNNYWLNIFIFKILILLTSLGAGWLILKNFSKQSFWLFAFNPLFLFETLVNGHNEIMVLILVTLAIILLLKKTANIKNLALSLNILTLSALFKFSTIIFWPWFFILALQKTSGWRQKILLGILSLGGSFILIYLLDQFFGGQFLSITGPIIRQIHISGSYSPLILIVAGLLFIFKQNQIWSSATIISQILFLLTALIIFWQILKSQPETSKWLASLFVISSLFILSFLSWLMPWYFLTPILLGSLLFSYHPSAKVAILNFGLSAYALIYYAILR